MTEFKVPELGENVGTGDVTRVLVNIGETITKEQPVLELETDKATIEVPSSVAGVVKEIKVKRGDKIKVGAVILVVDDGASGNGAGAKAPEAASSKAAASEKPVAPEKKQEPPAPQEQKVVSMPRPQAARPVEQ